MEIEKIVSDILDRYKENVSKAEGTLADSATYTTEWKGNFFEVYFNLQEYWKYVEYGTKPHFPPVDAIENWVVVKRIVPYTVKDRVPTTRELAYMICNTINNKGTKAYHQLQNTLDKSDDLINDLINKLTSQFEEQIDIEIVNL